VTGAVRRKASVVLVEVKALMVKQRGLALRRQVLDLGVPRDVLERLLADRRWVAVRRGVYATAEHWASLDEHRGQPLARAWAASLNMSMPHVLSHESAALAHGLPILRPRRELVHITRFGVQGCRTRHGVSHHLAPFRTEQIVDVEGVPTFDLARTAVDIARSHGPKGLAYGVVACDSALRAGATREELEAAVQPMRSWPGVTVAREAVAFADAGAESVGESLARLLVASLGLGEPETQFGLTAGGRTAWVDLRVGRHLVEFDGRVKYQRDGLADRPVEDVVWDEKRRQDWLCGFKLGMSRLTWEDVRPSAWDRTRVWLSREVLDTHRRFGTEVDDLAPYVVREPRRRAA
jgi:predicted transcriptional regulator of viral defense system